MLIFKIMVNNDNFGYFIPEHDLLMILQTWVLNILILVCGLFVGRKFPTKSVKVFP